MSKITRFTPRRFLTAAQNLERFILHAKNNLTLWSAPDNYAWENNCWPTTSITLRFINLESSSLHYSATPTQDQLMHPAFIDSAKAYLRYKHSTAPSKTLGYDIRSLRVLELALRKDMDIPDITKFNQRHWDLAVEITRPVKSRQTLCLNMHSALTTFNSLGILTADPTFWKHPYYGTHSYEAYNGSSADSVTKAHKLPNQNSLLAIAEVFARGFSEKLDDSDIMITSSTAVLVSAPIRISETLRLRHKCLDDDKDKNGKTQYFLKYWVPKLGEFDRKGIPSAILEVTQEAIHRLSTITEEGRKLARYMETEPTKFYRHAACPNVSDDQPLTPDQVMEALGFTKKAGCASFIQKATGRESLNGFTLNSLWQVVLKVHQRYNPNFPYQERFEDSNHPPLKMSESLFCFRSNQLSWLGDPSPVLLISFNRDYYSKRFLADEKAINSNFLVKHGYPAVSLRSHSFRHFLNRAGRASGVSIEMITEWSSRATTRQTRTYLNDDPMVAASKGAHLLDTIQAQEPLEPVTDKEIKHYDQGPFHRSRYGICRRTWRAGPCNKFAGCLNCSELLMCKGDNIALDIIISDRNMLASTYESALNAIHNGERSASRWTELAAPQIAKLDQLIAIMQNPSIPNGSPIETTGEDFSHEGTIVSEKAKEADIKLLSRDTLKISYGTELLACLDLLWKH